MRPTADLVDALHREELARARSMTPEEKFLEGPRLFERTCGIMADGIRHQHPDLDEAGVQDLLLKRLNTVDPRSRE